MSKKRPAVARDRLTSGQILERIRCLAGEGAANGDGSYAILTEVPEAVGGGCRRIDALGMTLWNSRGLELHGYEIKVSRSDWLRELKRPEKADGIYSYCDRWWIVVSSADVVKRDEFPQTWGLMVAEGAGLKVAIKAPKQKKPRAISRGFLAAIFRKAAQTNVDQRLIAAARREGYNAGVADARDETKNHSPLARELRHAKEQASRLEQRVSRFEKETGIDIDTYQGADIGVLVKIVQRLKARYIIGQGRLFVDNMRANLDAIEHFLAEAEDIGAECIDSQS
jgi:hypothetical protein